jgi:type III secretion protein J
LRDRAACGTPPNRFAWAKPLRGLAFAGLLLLAACKVDLYSGLEEREANEMVAILLHQGIPAERTATKDRGLVVSVEEDRFADAVDLLRRNGYPREHYDSIPTIFKGDGLVSSPVEEQARLIYALSQELSRTISQIDGVYSARVHVVLPDAEGLKASATPSSASVVIRHRADIDLTKLTPEIKMLVANGIKGLLYENVSVVFLPTAVGATTPPIQDPLTNIAGVWVHQSSAPWLEGLLTVLGLALAAAAAAVGWMVWRRRGAAPQAAE